MAYSQPPTVAELEAGRDTVVAAWNAAIAAVGSQQFCTLLAAAIQVMNEQRNELIAAYNASCGTYTEPGGNDPPG